MIKAFFIIILFLFGISCKSKENKKLIDLTQDSNTLSIEKDISDKSFQLYWQGFRNIIISKDTNKFVKECLDSVKSRAKTVDVNTFLKNDYKLVFDTLIFTPVFENKKFEMVNYDNGPEYFTNYFKKNIKDGKFIVKGVNIPIQLQNKYPYIVVLKFIETNSGYKYFGYDTF